MMALIEFFSDTNVILRIIIAGAAAATIISVALPLMARQDLAQRMKAVSDERAKIRKRGREQLEQKQALRSATKDPFRALVDMFNLKQWLGEEADRKKLLRAGYRSNAAASAFVAARLLSPLLFLTAGALYAYSMPAETALMMRIAIVIGAAYAGYKLPDMFVNSATQKRLKSMRKAFPDALDLLVICIESGMAAEVAIQRVSQEIGVQSIELAEEFAILSAEISYLPQRRTAYENLIMRTGLEDAKNVVMVLLQAEKYGTPLGAALRVVSQECRDARMNAAEKKAAALPPKLTVPMILFFVPVLFGIIIGPGIIKMMQAGGI